MPQPCFRGWPGAYALPVAQLRASECYWRVMPAHSTGLASACNPASYAASVLACNAGPVQAGRWLCRVLRARAAGRAAAGTHDGRAHAPRVRRQAGHAASFARRGARACSGRLFAQAVCIVAWKALRTCFTAQTVPVGADARPSPVDLSCLEDGSCCWETTSYRRTTCLCRVTGVTTYLRHCLKSAEVASCTNTWLLCRVMVTLYKWVYKWVQRDCHITAAGKDGPARQRFCDRR